VTDWELQPVNAYWLIDAQTGLTFKNCTFCPNCIYVFCIYLRTNRDFCTILYKLKCTGFWLGNLRERDHWGDPDVDGRIILRWIIRKWEGVVGTGWRWLRIGTGGGRLWVR
jgi:hypothetical protein